MRKRITNSDEMHTQFYNIVSIDTVSYSRILSFRAVPDNYSSSVLLFLLAVPLHGIPVFFRRNISQLFVCIHSQAHVFTLSCTTQFHGFI